MSSDDERPAARKRPRDVLRAGKLRAIVWRPSPNRPGSRSREHYDEHGRKLPKRGEEHRR